MEDFLVSVIIPCYNQGGFLTECVDSVLSQSYRNIEIIIVDDGSTDNTAIISKDLCSKDSRIFYEYKENGGLPSARNYGLSRAKGQFFLPLDSDDKLSPEYIERGVRVLNSNSTISLYNTNAIVFGNINQKWKLSYLGYKYILMGNTMLPTALYRTEDVRKIGGYDEFLRKGCEELEFFIRFLYQNDRIFHDDDYLFYYRKWGNNTMSTSAYSTNKKELFDYIYKKHIDKYVEYFGTPIEMLNSYSWAERKLPQLAKKIQQWCQTIKDKLH